MTTTAVLGRLSLAERNNVKHTPFSIKPPISPRYWRPQAQQGAQQLVGSSTYLQFRQGCRRNGVEYRVRGVHRLGDIDLKPEGNITFTTFVSYISNYLHIGTDTLVPIVSFS